MTLQLFWPETFFRLAGGYSAHWSEAAQVWWSRRCMDAIKWMPSTYPSGMTGPLIKRFEGAAVVQYGHRGEIDVIVPRYNAYVAELKRQHAADFPIAADGRSYNEVEVESVRDWLSSLDERMLGKLWKLSWAQGVEHAHRWHAVMAKAIEDQAAGERDISRRIDSLDGWTWCRLGSVWAMDREGAVMGHCVGQGSYDGYAEIDSDVQGIWSLRDDKGRSHVTAEIGYRLSDRVTYCLFQAKGPKNRRPDAGEQKHLDLLASELGLRTSEPETDYQLHLGRMYVGGGIGWQDIGMLDDIQIDVDAEQRRIVRLLSRVEMTMTQIMEPSLEAAEAVRQRAAANFTEFIARHMRVALGLEADDDGAIAGADIPAGSLVTRQHSGIMLAFDSQGGSRPDGSAIADAVANAPRRQRLPAPPPPHYRQHERHGRLHGRT